MIIAIVLMMLAGRNSEQGKLACNYDYQDILHRRIKNIEKECVSFSYWNTVCIRNPLLLALTIHICLLLHIGTRLLN